MRTTAVATTSSPGHKFTALAMKILGLAFEPVKLALSTLLGCAPLALCAKPVGTGKPAQLAGALLTVAAGSATAAGTLVVRTSVALAGAGKARVKSSRSCTLLSTVEPVFLARKVYTTSNRFGPTCTGALACLDTPNCGISTGVFTALAASVAAPVALPVLVVLSVPTGLSALLSWLSSLANGAPPTVALLLALAVLSYDLLTTVFPATPETTASLLTVTVSCTTASQPAANDWLPDSKPVPEPVPV